MAALSGNIKASQLAKGQKDAWDQITSKLKADEQRIWIHSASVGEFEQGRPLIEKLRDQFPQYKIVVTFFSPSGYELRKNYSGADYIFYLPFDTSRNARRFIKLIQPKKIYFIKYEFWRNYLRVIRQQKIPLFLVSANFRTDQVFFQWYGGWYRKLLKSFTWFFVQNERSQQLLGQAGFNNVTVTGDTRFDRVCSIVDQARSLPDVAQFVQDKKCMVAGSTWPPDTDLLVRYINTENKGIKWIFAPHELHDTQIDQLIISLKIKGIRYSQLSSVDPSGYDALVIDNIGMLSSLYRYGTFAYIGGGFGKGIHNTLEAAAYGIPVFFGPAYKKFQEAVDLVEQGGAFPIRNYEEFSKIFNTLLEYPEQLKQAGDIAGAFVASGRGATEKVIQKSMFSD
ncbi:MAG: 3-deoxy-D-manno-octulosonic acid transferase [Bacteroidales bacterium]|nr:3-deoxy-D-manno-octulosonic acid transferase [Bacteroidales bacterium]